MISIDLSREQEIPCLIMLVAFLASRLITKNFELITTRFNTPKFLHGTYKIDKHWEQKKIKSDLKKKKFKKVSPDFSQHERDVNEDDQESRRQKRQIVGDRRAGDVAK